MLEQSHPVLAFFLQYWTIAIFLPAVLLLIAVLVLVTGWRDGRDAVAAQQKARQAQPVPSRPRSITP